MKVVYKYNIKILMSTSFFGFPSFTSAQMQIFPSLVTVHNSINRVFSLASQFFPFILYDQDILCILRKHSQPIPRIDSISAFFQFIFVFPFSNFGLQIVVTLSQFSSSSLPTLPTQLPD